ncbi:hypothetical protein phiCbK_228 [Caulobacter phage phiCbK]|uniref:Uncharacterized protein n=5 Tax=Viruses TaxID=10239 RepID=K4JT66_9CAUD|nr:tail terminator [Caulobacter phage phiCbK]ARB14307.1 hypothetical protein Ccr5_gp089 [Caulobacter phage Ccr5]ARB15007.1 hypothetical protein Ccr32_gp088 [Caulobacter phage Ccr32]ARB15338.1 hypothetical protein Ccr34_gp095 [Caulobacter phage Ccr34]AFO71744.1 hypothetical protein phiCbK_228 [Caulobacter phage phiCbK]AFU86923.1 hypothetical protein CbK_gp091 [Caulobacter phage phiCbK]
MLEHDMLRQVLEQQAVAAAPTIGLKLNFDNSEFVQPKDGAHWAEFWVQTGNTVPCEVAGPRGYEKTSGLIQFTLKAPEEEGNGAILKKAGALKKVFNRRQWVVPPDGYVTLDPISVQSHGKPIDGFYNVVVWATLWFHHRDPDADDRWIRG